MLPAREQARVVGGGAIVVLMCCVGRFGDAVSCGACRRGSSHGDYCLEGWKKLQLRGLQERFVDIISLNDGDLGKTTLAQHKINTGNA